MKSFKKILCISLASLVILALFACGVKSTIQTKELAYETAAGSDYGFRTSSMKVMAPAVNNSYAMADAEENAGVYVTGKKLIRTIDISSETKEFDKAIEWLKSYIDSFSGIIDNSYIDSGNMLNNNYRKNAHFSVRVPSDSADVFLSKIGENLNVTFQQENVNDVTDSYDDTEKRKKTLLIEEEKLNELLKKAKAVEDLVAIESKLSEVCYEIQNIENRLKRFDKQIDYTTINIGITEVVDLTERIEETDYSKSNLLKLLNKNFEDTKRFVINLLVFIFTHIPAICLGLIVIIVILLLILWIKNIATKNEKVSANEKTELENEIKTETETETNE